MVPLNDENPTRTTPIVTYILITINVLVFIRQITLTPPQLEAFFRLYALVPRELTESFQGISSNSSVPEYLTLVTSQFLHGSFTHIGFNMLFLWVFGNNIEDRLGHVKYIIFYITCGILAALSQWIVSVMSEIPSLGASGAIAGVMGAYIIKFPNARILTLIPLGFFFYTVRIPAVFFLGFWFVQQALNSLLSLQVPSDMQMGGVAYWAHAGGFVFGAILGPLLGLFSRDG
ncbi:rhomboid family intramembrane serine protease [Candidatus Gracilibacteria bacterium]|nr:rhomboid family intramembrane serine protease [Candidatus Gracilibacteria bacterium]NJP20580.1 rhomboid family intramembrane serine protease [Hydrococcus sp. CRU_1_1]